MLPQPLFPIVHWSRVGRLAGCWCLYYWSLYAPYPQCTAMVTLTCSLIMGLLDCIVRPCPSLIFSSKTFFSDMLSYLAVTWILWSSMKTFIYQTDTTCKVFKTLITSLTVATVSLMQTPGHVTRCQPSDVTNNVIVTEPERRAHKWSEPQNSVWCTSLYQLLSYLTSHD